MSQISTNKQNKQNKLDATFSDANVSATDCCIPWGCPSVDGPVPSEYSSSELEVDSEQEEL